MEDTLEKKVLFFFFPYFWEWKKKEQTSLHEGQTLWKKKKVTVPSEKKKTFNVM